MALRKSPQPISCRYLCLEKNCIIVSSCCPVALVLFSCTTPLHALSGSVPQPAGGKFVYRRCPLMLSGASSSSVLCRKPVCLLLSSCCAPHVLLLVGELPLFGQACPLLSRGFALMYSQPGRSCNPDSCPSAVVLISSQFVLFDFSMFPGHIRRACMVCC